MLHCDDPAGGNFKTLGIHWDTKLKMDVHCHEVGERASWKLKSLLRARSFHSTDGLVSQYKSQVLPMLEFSTPAVYHYTDGVLAEFDKVQNRFLRAAGLTEEDALLKYNLAPLQARRDMALLGLIHRTVLGNGAPQFQKWFSRSTKPEQPDTRGKRAGHEKQLHDHLGFGHSELLRRSPLSLVRVCNKLGKEVVESTIVSTFQSKLQGVLKKSVREGNDKWKNCLNRRKQFYK